eukprot:Opistho-2@29301
MDGCVPVASRTDSIGGAVHGHPPVVRIIGDLLKPKGRHHGHGCVITAHNVAERGVDWGGAVPDVVDEGAHCRRSVALPAVVVHCVHHPYCPIRLENSPSDGFIAYKHARAPKACDAAPDVDFCRRTAVWPVFVDDLGMRLRQRANACGVDGGGIQARECVDGPQQIHDARGDFERPPVDQGCTFNDVCVRALHCRKDSPAAPGKAGAFFKKGLQACGINGKRVNSVHAAVWVVDYCDHSACTGRVHTNLRVATCAWYALCGCLTRRIQLQLKKSPWRTRIVAQNGTQCVGAGHVSIEHGQQRRFPLGRLDGTHT